MNITIAAAGLPTDKYPSFGNVEYDLAKALLAAGHKVTYLNFDIRSFRIKRRIGVYKEINEGVPTYTISLPLGARLDFTPMLQRLARYMFSKIEKEQGPQDIINAHFYMVGAICATIPLHSNVKLVVTEHSSHLNKEVSAIRARSMKLAREAYKNAAEVIAVSDVLASRLSENFNVKAHVIGDMVNVQTFSRVTKKQHSGFNLICVGRFEDVKGIESLIETMSLVVNENRGAKICLNIFGDGPDRALIERLIQEKNLTANIKLLGERPQKTIAQFLEISDVFVLLSNSETFGVSYAEAICAGVPVIATRCGGPESFVNSRNGILVSKENRVREAADAINEMINGKLSFTADSVKSTSEIFFPEHIVTQLETLFNHALH